MPLTGNWLRANYHRDPQFEVPHTPDPGHDVPGSVDENVAWRAQPYQPVGPSEEYVGIGWVTMTPGLTLDRTPVDHAPTPDGHTVDRGADQRLQRDEPAFQFTADRYEHADVDVDGPRAVSHDALVRGLNSNPANNPALASYGGDGWRQADYRWNYKDHDFRPPPRVHTYRIVRPNTYSYVGDAPPPDRPGPYNTPFSSLSRAIRNVFDKPELRRVPTSISEPVETDGSGSVDVPVFFGDF